MRSRRKCNWNPVVNAVRDWFDYVVNGRGGWHGVRDDQSNVAIGRYYRKWWKLHSKDYHRFLADGDLCGRYRILFGEERSFCKGRRRLMIQEVTLENITKQIGKPTVLTDICLTMKCGQICGITGENGSGKTMLMKMILGFVSPSSGSIKIEGKVLGKDISMPDRIGAIIENPGFLPEYSGFKNLKFLAMIHHKISNEEIRNAMRIVGLDPDSKKHVGKYSLGMRQRLGIAQAIMEDPDILLLDEPLNGLDNEGVEEIRKVLLSLKEKGKLIILASHSKEDIQILCDTVFRMDHGKIIATETN